jgi:phosphatidylserine decarboxylase
MSSHSAALLGAFQRGGWAPRNHQVIDDWVKGMRKHRLFSIPGQADDDSLIPAVKEFKEFIESDPDIFRGFTKMFEEQDPEAAVCSPFHRPASIMLMTFTRK